MGSTREAQLRPAEGENFAGQDTGREHVSHSALSTFLTCQRKYDWDKNHRLEPIATRRPLGMGRAYQLCIEHGDLNRAARVREGVDVLSQADEDRLRVEEVTVRAAAALYLDRWGTPPTERREVEYRVRLRSPWTGRYSNTFDLLGYADGVIERDAHLELIENKLVGRIDAMTVRKLPLDRQVTLACYGLWRATAKTVQLVHYRYVKKPSIKQRQGESIDEFLERLAGDYLARADFYAHEERLFRTPDDLLRIEAELWMWAEQLRSARRQRVWPRDTARCGDYGGCPFVALCAGDPDAASLYRVRPTKENQAA